MKKTAAIIAVACCMVFALTACASKDNTPTVPHSGPIVTPMEAESEAIQNAPAYDTEAAKRFIETMPAVRSLVDGVASENELVSFGNASPSNEAMQALQREVDTLSADNHLVSLIMVDLQTQSGVAYNPDIAMCTQSTIKGVYIGSVLDQNPAALEKDGQYMHDAIEFSSNDSYESLRTLYGADPLAAWCQEAGVDSSFAASGFPRTNSAKDMLKMWTMLYCYLNSGSEEAAAIAPYFADSSASATKKQLGDRYPVQTKAGWENGLDGDLNYDPNAKIPEKYLDGNPENDESAINDTGVVYTEKGPYLFVVFTNRPFGTFKDFVDVNPLYGLVEALHDVQDSL